MECQKFEADEKGLETEIPFEQSIEIGAFAAPVDGKQFGETLAREKSTLKSGKNTVTFETTQQPETAGVDPFLLLIDRVPEDNTRKVQGE